ncbi:MAG: DUF2339 domain-containing protein, partial [Planctomycetota bacterium]
MEGFFVLLFLLALACILCGPVALVISIIALGKTKRMFPERPPTAAKIAPEKAAQPPPLPERPLEVSAAEQRPVKVPAAEILAEDKKAGKEVLKAAAERLEQGRKKAAGAERVGLEQRIGTRWVLFAGIITVIFAVGFFLKYAYDTNLIGPSGRVAIAAFSGLVALAVGEITRRRGYGTIARAVTALGFAILYAAVFSA